MNAKNKTAKDLAFDRERAKFRKEIKELKNEIVLREAKIRQLTDDVYAWKTKCEANEDWIDRLLKYTGMSETDMKKIIKKEKDEAELVKQLNSAFSFMNGFPRY